LSESAAEPNSFLRIEAVGLDGQLLPDAAFTVFVNGKNLAGTESTQGFMEIQLSHPVRKLEVEARYKGDKRKIRVAAGTHVVKVQFDPGRRPPPIPAGPTQTPPQGPCTHRQRWGGLSEVSGRRLSAVVTDIDDDGFYFDLVVEATDTTPLQPPVRFHIHEDYVRPCQNINALTPDKLSARWREIWTDEAYVAAAQVRDAAGNWIGLEFDLNEIPELPKKLKDPKWIAWNKTNHPRPIPGKKMIVLTPNDLYRIKVQLKPVVDGGLLNAALAMCNVAPANIAPGGLDDRLTNALEYLSPRGQVFEFLEALASVNSAASHVTDHWLQRKWKDGR